MWRKSNQDMAQHWLIHRIWEFFCTFADDALLFMGRSPCCTEGNCLLSENTWPSNTLKFLFLQKSEEGFQFSISKCNGPSHLILLIVKHLYYSHCRPDELAPYYNNLICNVFHVWYQKYLGNKALCHYYLIYY